MVHLLFAGRIGSCVLTDTLTGEQWARVDRAKVVRCVAYCRDACLYLYVFLWPITRCASINPADSGPPNYPLIAPHHCLLTSPPTFPNAQFFSPIDESTIDELIGEGEIFNCAGGLMVKRSWQSADGSFGEGMSEGVGVGVSRGE